MVSSISSTATDSIQLMMAQMYQKIGAADTDGTAGLSKDELSSIDSSSDAGGTAFLQSLSDQFSQLDTDGNGELSSSEIALAKPPSSGPMGPPPGLDIGTTDDTSKTSSTTASNSTDSTNSTESSSTKDLIEQLFEKLMKALSDSFSKDSSEASANGSTFENAISSLGSTANTDGTAGLSKSELAAVDTSKDPNESKLISDLVNKFNSLDKDGDGQLSQSEMQEILKGKQFSTQELASIAKVNSSENSNSSSLGNSFNDLTSSFVQKLLNSYRDGGLSTIASSVGLSV